MTGSLQGTRSNHLRRFIEIAAQGPQPEQVNAMIDEVERALPHMRGQIQRVPLPEGRPQPLRIGYSPQKTVDDYFGDGGDAVEAEVIYLPRKKRGGG